MCESARDKELAMVAFRQLDCDMFPESRRASTYIHSHIQDGPFYYPHKLALGMRGLLEMSNTDLTQEFIKVIESQRAFSYCLKMVTATDEIETTFNNLRG